ncbi:hypothetical protein JCM19047_2504 [Bacillus sp. JCM 19047]|nr:hypothetical protein JCM19047_2504 [Bacillus sp. JCM 19047]
MFGLGKPRSQFGKWLDKNSISTVEFAKESGVGRNTIGIAANDKEYVPGASVTRKIMRVVRKIEGDAEVSDFWRL